MPHELEAIDRSWLGAIALGLVAVHLILIWKLTAQVEPLIVSSLFWGGIGSRLWQRRSQLHFSSHRLAQWLGLFLLSATLVKSLSLFWFEGSFVRLFPLLAAVAWALLASGFGWRQYSREALLLLPLVMPQNWLEQGLQSLIGPAVQTFTAQIAGFLLHYLGFTVVPRGAILQVNDGSIEVLFHCTGIPALIVLLQLALLFFVVFPTRRSQQASILAVAVLLALLVSSGRVALMALVVGEPHTFAYWHGPQGSQIFSTVAIVLFGWFCQAQLPTQDWDEKSA